MLAQAWAVGPIQAELAMMVLARLIEDCHDVDFRSEVRGWVALAAALWHRGGVGDGPI